MPPSLDIVIVNWNTGQALRECIKSAAEADRAGFALGRVVVVDNASTDESWMQLEAGDLPIEVQRNSVNRGFAAACNQGAGGSAAQYLLFLNPDTRLFSGSLTRPIAFMERAENRTVGICGVRLLDDAGRETISCARFPTPITFLGQATGLNRLLPTLFKPHLLSADECRTTRIVDQVIGAFFLVRRELFDRLGGFDERFFVYFEEVDFALRARRLGFVSMVLADSTACHVGSVSSDQIKDARLFYSLRSRLAYGRKHYTSIGNAALWAVTFGIEFPVRLGRALAGGSLQDVANTVRGYRALVWDFLRVDSRSSHDLSVW
jgi:N-acetylglucosaminyl-diphospho-decaprenol L-rhamnosyltransferase